MSELQHHGILGMKWGIRRYQNKDGSLTNEGRQRYRMTDSQYKELKDASDRSHKAHKEEIEKRFEGSNLSRKIRSDRAQYEGKAFYELGKDLADNMAKNDQEYADALGEYRKHMEEAETEWKRITDQKYIDSIGSNANDPRHEWFEFIESTGHYEFYGDRMEFWQELADPNIQERVSDANEKYRKACFSAMSRMCENLSSHQIKRAIDNGERILNMPEFRGIREYLLYNIA